MWQRVAQSGVVDLCLQHVGLCHRSTCIVPQGLTLHHLALPLHFEDHILFVARKLVFCWTSVIVLLPMAWFVGPMLNGADVLPFVQFFAFIVLDADHQMSVRA